MKNLFKLFICFVLLFPTTQVFGASVFFDSKESQFSVGQDFLVELVLDAEEQSPNAVSGQIVFDPKMLSVKEIRDGNSTLNFWIERPTVDKLGKIIFSGITPGGLSPGTNLIFGVVFHAEKDGNGTVSFGGLEVLKNDGSGGKIQTKETAFNFSINTKTNPPVLPEAVDNEPPEDFKPSIGKDPEMFEGKYFVVFTTQDKGVGIDHYEIKEGFWGKYQRAESPYLLADQSLPSKIYIKAIDKALNERVVSFAPDDNKNWYERYYILGIIGLVLILFGYYALKKSWLKYPRQY